MRRVVWFVGGAAAGASGVVYAKRKVAEAVDKVRPSNLAHPASSSARRAVNRLGDAVREGATAARRRERELIAERDGRLIRLSDYLTDGDEVVIDGQRVDSAKVVVLRQTER
jgi:hypothetical protein